MLLFQILLLLAAVAGAAIQAYIDGPVGVFGRPGWLAVAAIALYFLVQLIPDAV
jgi:hypothetical protein